MKEEYPDLQKFSDIAKKSVNETVQENIQQFEADNRAENMRLHGCDCPLARCEESCPRYLAHYASRAEFWDWWGKTSPPNNRAKEVMPPGEPVLKGSRSSRKKRKRPKPKFWRPYMLD